ncbi:MAG: exodeoxyribonuclease VII small subunit [Deltaproteobacteria bacterium]|nr:exodeoxyribonuclease VII small subunit [Deltaproteobacteria bacterium]
MAEETEPSFEAILKRLEAITQELEKGDTRLEQALALYEEGVTLARRGALRLEEAERKIEILRGDKREPFVPKDDASE